MRFVVNDRIQLQVCSCSSWAQFVSSSACKAERMAHLGPSHLQISFAASWICKDIRVQQYQSHVVIRAL